MPRLALTRADLDVSAATGDGIAWVEAEARRCGAAGDLLDRLVLAAGEAIANAVEHGAGDVFVELVHESDRYGLRVLDEGAGLAGDGLASASLPDDPLAPRGRGLFLMRTLADEVAASRGGVELWFRPRHG